MARGVGSLQRRLEIYGRTHYGEDVIEDGKISANLVMRKLYFEEKMSVKSLSRTFNISVQGIYDFFRRRGIKTRASRRTQFSQTLQDKGYANARQFFAANAHMQFTEMAKELGVTPATISKYYKLCIQQGLRGEEEHGEGEKAGAASDNAVG